MATSADSLSSIIISVEFPQVTLLKRERLLSRCSSFRNTFHIPFNPSTIKFNQYCFGERGCLYEKFLSSRSLPCPFCFRPSLPPRQTVMPSLKLVRIGVMHDGRLLSEKSFWLTAGFKSTSPSRPFLRRCEDPDKMEKHF